MNYYLHRISHESDVSYTLFKKGINGEIYLSLGWLEFSNTNILDAARLKDGNVEFEKIYDSIENKKYKSRWNMWYLAQFKKGDLVIVPLYDGRFSVCEVLEEAKSIKSISDNSFKSYWNKYDIYWDKSNECYTCNGRTVDLGFVVKVKKLYDDISRNDYANSILTSRLKMRQTNGNIDDIKESVDVTIEALKKDRPINFHDNSIDKLAPSLYERIEKDLNPDKFELLVKSYMEKLGANVIIPPKNQPGKEDYADADVVAYFDNINVAILIQAKHHKDETNSWAVEQISKYKEQLENPDSKLDDGMSGYTYIPWVVSTCRDYTEEAKINALNNNIRLINGMDFAKMLLEQGLYNIDLN